METYDLLEAVRDELGEIQKVTDPQACPRVAGSLLVARDACNRAMDDPHRVSDALAMAKRFLPEDCELHGAIDLELAGFRKTVL
jgi:hypothetical protein